MADVVFDIGFNILLHSICQFNSLFYYNRKHTLNGKNLVQETKGFELSHELFGWSIFSCQIYPLKVYYSILTFRLKML